LEDILVNGLTLQVKDVMGLEVLGTYFESRETHERVGRYGSGETCERELVS